MKKKCLAMLLAVVLAFSLLPGTAFAVAGSGKCGDNVTWTLSGGVLTVSGTGPMMDYGSWLFPPWEPAAVHTLIIGDGVTSIGDNAFGDCIYLTSVTIPNSVTSIGEAAFSSCGILTSVTIPASVTTIGDSAFEYCRSLTSVTIPDGVTAIGRRTFRWCISLTSVTIPNSVTTIGDSAFDDCWSLTSVTIPNSVTTIGEGAFAITVIDQTSVIGTGLTSVTIPVSVTSIGNRAFYRCKNLTDVYYGGSESQWNQISIDNSYDYNAPLLNATIHYNSVPTQPAQPETPKITFTDIGEDSWCRDAVSWAVEKGITNGYPGNIFGEGYKCTNIQILTFLYRAVRGEGEASGDDMEKAVSWAREHNMIGDGFERDANCTRSDAVMFIWQVKGSPAPANSSSFTDVPAGTAYADAVSWAAENGVANGYGSSFGPKDTCTRGQIVTFLHRALAD